MENMWNLKKNLVVGIFQQLYIVKALYIHFQEGRKNPNSPAIHSVKHIHTHQNTKVRNEMKSPRQ